MKQLFDLYYLLSPHSNVTPLHLIISFLPLSSHSHSYTHSYFYFSISEYFLHGSQLDSDNEGDDNIQYFARKKNNSGLHRYDSNSLKDKKNEKMICVNETDGGGGSSDVLYKLNVDVDNSRLREIEKNKNCENIIDENTESFADNLRKFPDVSGIEMTVSELLNDEGQMVSYEEDNRRPVDLSFSTYPTEEKEEDCATTTAVAAAVTTTTTVTATLTSTATATLTRNIIVESEIPSSFTTLEEVTTNVVTKDDIMPMQVPMPMSLPMQVPMPLKSHDVNSREQIPRRKNDRLKRLQTDSWNRKDNLTMESNTNTSTNTSASLLSPTDKSSSGKHSSFAALSGWTLKKQFKNVFGSQSVPSTSPTTGTLLSSLLLSSPLHPLFSFSFPLLFPLLSSILSSPLLSPPCACSFLCMPLCLPVFSLTNIMTYFNLISIFFLLIYSLLISFFSFLSFSHLFRFSFRSHF